MQVSLLQKEGNFGFVHPMGPRGRALQQRETKGGEFFSRKIGEARGEAWKKNPDF